MVALADMESHFFISFEVIRGGRGPGSGGGTMRLIRHVYAI